MEPFELDSRRSLGSIARDLSLNTGPGNRNSTVITPLECPLEWARQANSFDCVCYRDL